MRFAFKRKPEPRDGLNIIVIAALVALFVWIGIHYTRAFGSFDINDPVGSAEELKQFILSYGNAGLLIMVLMHTVQVIISFIPSVLVQFVGGAIYGMTAGMVTGIIGIAIGTAVSFYLSRFLGRRVVTLLISEKNIEKIEKLISGNMSTWVLLVLFVLPTPKDFFAYFMGLTNMKASRFFIISAVGRLPGMLVANYLGTHVFDRNYAVIVLTAVGSSLLFLLLLLFWKKFSHFLQK